MKNASKTTKNKSADLQKSDLPAMRVVGLTFDYHLLSGTYI